jgi:hypothetical protein
MMVWYPQISEAIPLSVMCLKTRLYAMKRRSEIYSYRSCDQEDYHEHIQRSYRSEICTLFLPNSLRASQITLTLVNINFYVAKIPVDVFIF